MDATDLRLKDTGEVITDKEWKRAVDCIIKNHREALPELKKVIEEKGKDWSLGYHRSLGLSVRNTLRREGFHWGRSASMITGLTWLKRRLKKYPGSKKEERKGSRRRSTASCSSKSLKPWAV
jgi:hypothetical protein